MSDRIFWYYLEELPEQEAAWKEWQHSLSGWHRFNTFYTHYLRVDGRRVKLLNCPVPCEHGYLRQVVENSPSDITAVCPQNQADPIQLKFRDILIYALRREAFHQSLCTSLNIKYEEDRQKEHKHVCHLGDYSGTEVYITYRTAPAVFADTISSIYLSHQKPFILMVPTIKNIAPEIQQFIDKNNSILFPMADELNLQQDGSFRLKRSIAECMKPSNQHGQQYYQGKILPIEAYKYLAYNE
ncbi:MAG: hypothetical protein WCI51_00155 [Lentisphaerota bacterium]